MPKTYTSSAPRGANLRGRAWNLPFNDVDPTGADDHFLYLRNDGRMPLEIVGLEIWSTVAGYFEIFRASGTPDTPTDITNTIAPLGESNNLPKVLFQTGVDLQLTVDKWLGRYYLSALIARHFDHFAGIIIPTGKAIGVNWSAATGLLTGHWTIVELTEDERLS